MDLNTQRWAIESQTVPKFLQISFMLLICGVLIAIMNFVWNIIYAVKETAQKGQQKSQKSNKKSLKSKSNYNQTQQINQEEQMRHTLKFNFNQQSFDSQEQQIHSIINEYQRQPQYPTINYSFKQGRRNFLNNLRQQQPQNMIYFDKKDLQQRQKMLKYFKQKKAREQNEIIVKTQQSIIKQKQVKNPQQINLKGQNIKKPIGEKQIFADKDKKKQPQKQVQKPKQQKVEVLSQKEKQNKPQVSNKPISFAGISLGGKTVQNKQASQPATTPAQNKPQTSLFGNINILPTNGLFSTQNKTNSLFPQLNPTIPPKTDIKPAQNIQKPEQKKAQNLIKKQEPPKNNSLFGPSPPSPIAQVAQNKPSKNQVANQLTTNKKAYLQKFVDFGNKASQTCELTKTKTNNFGRSISNLKELYETTVDFINTINVGNPKQVQTLACKVFDFLLNKNIPSWPKQQGWQKFPPRSKQGTMWKISINTYVLKLNLYRSMGYQKIWLIVFGKLLSLLDFTWKRQNIIKSQKDLDLIKNGYFNMKGQDEMAAKYFTRLDLITYFLFCMTTFDPQLFAQYLCQTAKQDQHVYQQIKKYKYKWNYNYFWILTDTILANKAKTYFKPILYMNMLSSIYLQLRRNKINSTEFSEFQHLKKFLLKEAFEYTRPNALQSNQEVAILGRIDVDARDYKFDGQDFTDQLQTLNFYFKEKETQYKLGIQQFQKKCSNFDYFKSQGSIV